MVAILVIVHLRVTVKRSLLDVDMQSLKRKWESLYNNSYDPEREDRNIEIFSKASGVYLDSQKADSMNTTKTVLISVLSVPSGQSQHTRYRHLLQNWYCFTNEYGLKHLTYIVPHESITFDQQILDLDDLSVNTIYNSYPTELFWSFVKKKQAHRGMRSGRVDYLGDIPSFNHFGAFVMLVPILEVLQYGYDVIYMDVDMAFLRDPIPYLMRSSSEFIVSLESRDCRGPSDPEMLTTIDVLKLEPNTGFMRVKSTTHTKRIFNEWLIEIVESNISNDQKALFFEGFGARISFDCNEQIKHLENTFVPKYLRILSNHYNILTHGKISAYPRYCFLNEYLIQNGKTAFHCTNDERTSAKADYYTSIMQQNFTSVNPITGVNEEIYYPAVIHANYFVTKFLNYVGEDYGLLVNKTQHIQ